MLWHVSQGMCRKVFKYFNIIRSREYLGIEKLESKHSQDLSYFDNRYTVIEKEHKRLRVRKENNYGLKTFKDIMQDWLKVEKVI